MWVRWDCVASCMLEFWDTPLYSAPVSCQWSVCTLNFVGSYPTVRNSCKKPKLQYFTKNQIFLCTCSFFLALKEGSSGFLAFINSPDIFQWEYSIIKGKRAGFLKILIAIHKRLAVRPSQYRKSDSLKWASRTKALLDLEMILRISICL